MRDYLEELLGQLPQGEEEELAAQWLPPSGRWSGWDGAIQDTLGELWEALGGRFQELKRSTAERAALSSSDALGETAAFLTAVLEGPQRGPNAPGWMPPGEERRAVSPQTDMGNTEEERLDTPERQEEARRRPALLLQVRGVAVGVEIALLHHGQHPLAGGLAHIRVLVEHPGHRGHTAPGQPGDIPYGHPAAPFPGQA